MEAKSDKNFDGNIHNQVFASLVLCATVISSVASIVLLILIKRMGSWNGHILLVTTMTVFQLIYDMSFFTGVISVGSGLVTILSNMAQLFSGVLVSVMSNWVAWVAFFVIYFRRRFDIFKSFSLMLSIALIPATLDIVLYALAIADSSSDSYISLALLVVYNFIKFLSILLNIIFVSWTALLTRKMRSENSIRSHAEVSINSLSIRLFYYPLVQMLSRSGCAWYEMQYGYDFTPSSGMTFNPSHTSNQQFAAQCLMALSMPVASVGYLLIFVMMQSKALGLENSPCGEQDDYDCQCCHTDDSEEVDCEVQSTSGVTEEGDLNALLLSGG